MSKLHCRLAQCFQYIEHSVYTVSHIQCNYRTRQLQRAWGLRGWTPPVDGATVTFSGTSLDWPSERATVTRTGGMVPKNPTAGVNVNMPSADTVSVPARLPVACTTSLAGELPGRRGVGDAGVVKAVTEREVPVRGAMLPDTLRVSGVR